MPKNGLVAGDGGSIVKVHILDSETEAAIDLTGKTVKLRYSLNGAAAVTKTMTALDQTNFKGWAQYQFLTTDLTAAGDLEGETRLNDGLSDQLTSDSTFHIAVRGPLP
jgi:hypothetical protein